MKKLLQFAVIGVTALALAGCGLFEKKADPNFERQMKAYEQAVAAKKEVDVAKAEKKGQVVQVLTIKGDGKSPIIMSGISEISVNLPTELFEKGAAAAVETPIAIPSVPVEQPNFLERTADKLVSGFIASIPVLGQTFVQVNGQRESTKQIQSTNQMWTTIISSYKPSNTTTTTTTDRSNNSGGNVGDSAGENRQNQTTTTSGNSGMNSGDNRENPVNPPATVPVDTNPAARTPTVPAAPPAP